jgi:hypothetical protein
MEGFHSKPTNSQRQNHSLLAQKVWLGGKVSDRNGYTVCKGLRNTFGTASAEYQGKPSPSPNRKQSEPTG